jgi:hypothetical protein
LRYAPAKEKLYVELSLCSRRQKQRSDLLRLESCQSSFAGGKSS